MRGLLHLVQSLLAVPNVTAHPSTANVPTSYYLMWHYNCLWTIKGQCICAGTNGFSCISDLVWFWQFVCCLTNFCSPLVNVAVSANPVNFLSGFELLLVNLLIVNFLTQLQCTGNGFIVTKISEKVADLPGTTTY